jgi:SAM-dependent methyltransferase
MPFNTTAAFHVFEARKYLPQGASVCQLCRHVLEMSDDFIHWLLPQSGRYPFIDTAFFKKMLTLDRESRMPFVKAFHNALGFGPFTMIESDSQDGAVVADFNLHLQRDYNFTATFDFVNNNGTTEHVFDQRMVFENIHNLCKTGGIMLHRIPMFGVLNIMLYGVTPCFLHDLALANRYEIIDLRVGNRWGESVPVAWPGRDTSGTREFRGKLPAFPGHVRGAGIEDAKADKVLSDNEVPEELRLPDSLTLEEMIQKAPLTNLTIPLSRVCHALAERGRRYRPDNPGEIYAMALLRKTSDEPFVVPYQSKSLKDIEPRDMRNRYRNQFQALGLPID